MKLPGPPLDRMFPDVVPVPNELGRYRVASRTGPYSHLVDLFEHGFNGACDCEHFQYRLLPRLAQGVPVNNEMKCYHIRRAEAHLLETMKRALWQQANPQRTVTAAPWPEGSPA